MASMYSQILKEKKEEREKYSVLRRACPVCKKFMHRLNDGWCCNYCYKKFDIEGKEVKHNEKI